MQDVLAWLSHWYNLIFVAPLMLGAGLTLIEVFTGGLGDLLGVDIDFDADVDADVGIDIDVDADIGHHPVWLAPLAWLGVGVVPVTILLEVLCVSFGGSGLLVNAVGYDLLGTEWIGYLTFLPALGIALTVAPFFTKVVGMGVAKYIPQNASTLKPPGFYIGETGEVTVTLTERIGEVCIKPHGSEPLFLEVRRAGDTDIPKNSPVVLVGFDEEYRTYRAEAADAA